MVSFRKFTINTLFVTSILAQSITQVTRASVPTDTSSSKAAEVSPPPLSDRDKCLIDCGAGNVACQAKCDNLPNPTQDEAKNVNSCYGKCHNDKEINRDQKQLLSCLEQCSPSSPNWNSGGSSSDSSKGNGTSSKNNSTGNSTKSGGANNSGAPTPFFVLSTSFLMALGVTVFY